MEVCLLAVCMFTGHRPHNLPFCYDEKDYRCIGLKKLLKKSIVKKIRNENVDKFLTGMALGVDCFAAEIVLELTEEYPQISLTAVLPCANQTRFWKRNDIKRYNMILKKCSDVVLLQRKYSDDCMNKRNMYMVEHSDCVIAVWNGGKGGTYNTVRYALFKNLSVRVINPDTLSIYNLEKL